MDIFWCGNGERGQEGKNVVCCVSPLVLRIITQRNACRYAFYEWADTPLGDTLAGPPLIPQSGKMMLRVTNGVAYHHATKCVATRIL
jgi:hypothetical protein